MVLYKFSLYIKIRDCIPSQYILKAIIFVTAYLLREWQRKWVVMSIWSSKQDPHIWLCLTKCDHGVHSGSLIFGQLLLSPLCTDLDRKWRKMALLCDITSGTSFINFWLCMGAQNFHRAWEWGLCSTVVGSTKIQKVSLKVLDFIVFRWVSIESKCY